MSKRRLSKAAARPPARRRSAWTFWALAGAALIAVAGAVGYFAFWSQPEVARVGQPAPDFTLQLLNGESVRLSSLRGRPVLVNFWHST